MSAGRVDVAHAGPRVALNSRSAPPAQPRRRTGGLGSLLIDPHLSDEVVLILRPSDFYADAHRKLFAHMVAMHDEGRRDRRTTLPGRASGPPATSRPSAARPTWPKSSESAPVAAHAAYYARIVRERNAARADPRQHGDPSRRLRPTLESREMLDQAEEKIFAVHDGRSTDQVAPSTKC